MIAQGAYLPPSQLRIDHDRYKNESISYKNECDRLNGVVQQKDSDINSYKSQLSISNSQLSSVNSTNNSFKAKEQSLNAEIQNKNKIINTHVAKISLLEGSNILLLQQIDGLQLDKKDLRTDKAKLNDEIEILKNTILKKDLLIEEKTKEIEKLKNINLQLSNINISLKKSNLDLSVKSKLFVDKTLESILPNEMEESLLISVKEENKSYSLLQ